MRVVAILQARMNSIRLPGKMLLPLAGAPLVQRVMERVQRATKLDDVVLAFPATDLAALLQACTDVRVWPYPFPGDEHDLVARYLAAATAFDAELIVRIPCDNPCVDPWFIDRAVDAYMDTPSVYYSNTSAWNSEHRKHVDGFGAEVFSLSRLRWLDARTKGRPDWREHPHRYFEDHRVLALHPVDIRLDVNTQADYEFVKDIYDHFNRNDFTAAEVMEYLHQKQVPA